MDEQHLKQYLNDRFAKRFTQGIWFAPYRLLKLAVIKGLASTLSLHGCADEITVSDSPEKTSAGIRQALGRVAKELFDPSKFSASGASCCALIEAAFPGSTAMPCLVFVTVKPISQQSVQVLVETRAMGWTNVVARTELKLLKDYIAKQFVVQAGPSTKNAGPFPLT
jgi:hypothetical protein